jgi:hypothetical protein
MGSIYAAGKRALGICDRCGFQYKLKMLKEETIAGISAGNRVCGECFDPDHPQLMLGRRPVTDAQALQDPRPDTTYDVSGPLADGTPGTGSR